jgi:Domain of unknown function (DUF4082)/Bacterial Ig-like domain (group 2)
MGEINVVSTAQRIVVDPASYSVSIIHSGSQGPPGSPGAQGDPGQAGGSLMSSFWSFATATTSPPGSGQMRTNTAMTELWISEIDTDGFNRQVGLGMIVSGALIYVRAANGTFIDYQITGTPIDNGTWWSFPITTLGGGPITKGARTQINFVIQSVIGIPPGGTVGQVLIKLSDSNYDVGWGDGGTITPPPDDDYTTIAAENALGGYAEANWAVSGAGDLGAIGFATAMSVSGGTTLNFKVHSGGIPYTIEIIRLGWYGGLGARLIHSLSHPAGAAQSDGTLRTEGVGGVGSRDCSGWTVTDTWFVPVGQVRGLYLGVIKRTGQSEFAHIGPFIVNDDHSADAKIAIKLSDATWQAYNAFGTNLSPLSGRGLYGASGMGTMDQGNRTWDVTYDRPLIVADGVPQTTFWNGERPVHAFLERNGYDVTYVSCVDVDSAPYLLLGRSVIISAGHDEYWSQGVRDAWDTAISTGVHAIIMSGNTMLWRIRHVGRRIHCYKDSHSLDGFGSGSDPVSWTGTWRDTRWASRKGENETIGALFVANGIRSDEIVVPVAYNAEKLWRNTSIAGSGSPITLKSDSLGFEWDSYEPSYTNTRRYPDGLKFLSETSINLTGQSANENGSTYASTINPAKHYIVAFKKGSSVTVNFGTNQWGWGLSDFHVRGVAGTSVPMQQATVNLLADMGVQPAALQSGLTIATNQLSSWSWPTLSSISVTPATRTLAITETQQLLALATWSNGVVTDVTATVVWESSIPGKATVSSTGLITGVAGGSTSVTATKSGITDDCAVTVTGGAIEYDSYEEISDVYSGTVYIDGAINIGVRIKRVGTGAILVHGIRYWRTATNQPTAPSAHYTPFGGTGIATTSKTSTVGSGTTTAGWETILFDTPVTINDNGDHSIWLNLPGGGYAATLNYFATQQTSNLGLFQSPSGSGGGCFKQPPVTANSEPPSGGGVSTWYWLDPLVTLA